MNKLSLVALIGMFLFNSCEEEPLPIPMTDPVAPLVDTTYVNSPVSAKQHKVAMFEEFTGVRCPNCPQGHAVMKAMAATYGDQLVMVSIHDSSQFNQAAPFKGDVHLSTFWAKQIFTMISKPNGIPYGIVDRLAGDNVSSLWDNLVATRLQTPSVANVELKIISFDESTHELRYEVKFELTEDVNEPLFFSTAISQDSIIGKQEDGSIVIDDYVHNHILRDMPQFSTTLNPTNNPPATKGRVFLKQYIYFMDPDWVVEHCKLIAYIHKPVEILQAAEVHIK
ncbi:MAG: Omp28-related outer membrane protein [Bacteroidetes bacterium]|nr:Omp28-related outer membrane protein [Bacteroidota bacterium]